MWRRLFIPVALALLLLSVQAVRGYAVTAAGERFHARVRLEPVGQLRESLRWVAAAAPEAPAFFAASGQALLLLSRHSEQAAAPLVAGMALADLQRALARNPAAAELWIAAALAAQAAGRPAAAEALAAEAARRAPWSPEMAWVAARLARSPAARAAFYRRVTAVRPAAAPGVVAEAAPRRPWPEQAKYVAGTPAAYRAWAWSVTGEAGVAIARQGLALAERLDGAAADAGWLAYYLALAADRQGPAASLPWYRQALEALPEEQAVHRNYGFALLRAGRPAEAEAAFGESIRRNGDLGNAAHLGRAEAWAALGRGAEARELFERLTKNARLEAWIRREAGHALARFERTP